MNNIGLFKNIIDNFATRALLSRFSCYCKEDGKNRIEVALELYIGIREHACWKCKMAEKAIVPILKKGASAFNVSEDELKKQFKDSYWRKGLASVVKGLVMFGMKKPFVPGAPFQVVWEVTHSCNLRCKHCSANAGRRQDELTTEEALRAIDKLEKLGVTIIAFSGGEPLIREDIFKLTKYAADKGIYVAIATNGTLLNKETVRQMKNAGIKYVQVSLDGASAETHDSFRGVPGMFQRTMRGIRNLVKENFFVNIATVVTKQNYNEIPRIIDLCEKMGVDWFMAYNFIPTGRGKEIMDMDISPKEREELLKMLYTRMKNSKLNLLSTAPQFARVALQVESGCGKTIPTHFYNVQTNGKLESLAEFIGGCGAGRFYFAMKPNGDIQPCVFLPLKIGNVMKDDLENLWENNTLFRELRNKDILKPHCGECEYRYYCGGCRARAYAYFGDYLAPDPGCINNEKKNMTKCVTPK